MYKYYFLAVFCGICIKLYDDLKDNNLYGAFGLKPEYVNEILKCLFGISFIVLSQKSASFYLFFLLANVMFYLLKNSDYGPFEFAGLVSCLAMIPFVPFHQIVAFKFDFIVVLLLVINFLFSELATNIVEVEYSYKKLTGRVLITLGITFWVTWWQFHDAERIHSKQSDMVMFFGLGYFLTSCAFQMYLISNKERRREYLKKSKKKPKKSAVIMKILKMFLKISYNFVSDYFSGIRNLLLHFKRVVWFIQSFDDTPRVRKIKSKTKSKLKYKLKSKTNTKLGRNPK